MTGGGSKTIAMAENDLSQDYSFDGCDGNPLLMGQRARRAGLDDETCAFEDGTNQAILWHRGWAQEDAKQPDTFSR